MCASYTFTWQMVYEIEFVSVIRGHHVYKTEFTKAWRKASVSEDEQKEAVKYRLIQETQFNKNL